MALMPSISFNVGINNVVFMRFSFRGKELLGRRVGGRRADVQKGRFARAAVQTAAEPTRKGLPLQRHGGLLGNLREQLPAEQVDPGVDPTRAVVLAFLFESPDQAIVVQLHASIAPGVGHAGQKQRGGGLSRLVPAEEGRQVRPAEGIAVHDQHRLGLQHGQRQPHRAGGAQGRVLARIGHAQAGVGTSEDGLDLFAAVAHAEHHVAKPLARKVFQKVGQERLSVDGGQDLRAIGQHGRSRVPNPPARTAS